MSLAGVDGVADVGAYEASVADHAARLADLAGDAGDPLMRAELQLTAANLILAKQIEPACTRTFWGLTAFPEHRVDSQKLTAGLDRAQRLLTDARSNINDAREAAPKDEPESPAVEEGAEKEVDPTVTRILAASTHQRTLEAFRQALATALLPAADAGEGRTRRRAASELAALVEHDDRRVATAAGFWQAYLRKDETDPRAALARLDYALDDFGPSEKPYAFFARVMRCRVLEGHGQRVAAFALLTQMEERTFGWYLDEEPRAEALRAIAWTKLQALRAWHDGLDAQTKTDERAWCREQATTIIDDTLVEANELPRLSPVIPMLYDADAIETRAAVNDAP
jgi:hypothetical protein